jgi:hypothetical protein
MLYKFPKGKNINDHPDHPPYIKLISGNVAMCFAVFAQAFAPIRHSAHIS